MSEGKKLAVGICTYRRQASLMRLLQKLPAQFATLNMPIVIIVVDNDGTDPVLAKAVNAWAAANGASLTFRTEQTPGISAARNTVFEEAFRQNIGLIAMLDDDEWPSEFWLRDLVRVQEEEQVAVVGGPGLPVFPAERQWLTRYQRFWSVQKQLLHGRVFVFCTCNFLIDIDCLRALPRPLFNPAFGLTGGGDTEFFRRLFFAGHKMAWAESAAVYEEVSLARASIGWLRTRRYRVGNHAVRWEQVGGSRLRSLVKTAGLALRLPFYPLLAREPEASLMAWLLEYEKIRGRLAAHAGSLFVEYARPEGSEANSPCR